ncbi:hypothetical protein EWM64_g4138 [Hericium alpestre]|uniref:Uncharacterized protein n=1 Tax=Hericium alpestre TaxID=135208 RepID=A0A4Z0A088_9AGAM|nr:hypothetical protein EWM64_g4138 [Hericium alpestre]
MPNKHWMTNEEYTWLHEQVAEGYAIAKQGGTLTKWRNDLITDFCSEFPTTRRTKKDTSLESEEELEQRMEHLDSHLRKWLANHSKNIVEGKGGNSSRASKPKPLTLKVADLGNNHAPSMRDLMQKDPKVQEHLVAIRREGFKDGKSIQTHINEELTEMLKDLETLRLWNGRAMTEKAEFHEKKKEKKAAQIVAAEIEGTSKLELEHSNDAFGPDGSILAPLVDVLQSPKVFLSEMFKSQLEDIFPSPAASRA